MKTPSGSPASRHSSAIHSAAVGTFSDGFSTTVFPAAIAIGKNHIGTMAGKLNGEMIPTTPSGWRIDATSTPVDAFSVAEPFSRCGAPQANSTTSWPRATSPAASESTLPCSQVMIAASSPDLVEQLPESEQDLRSPGQRGVPPRRERRLGRRDHLRGLSADASGTRPVTSPVAGSVTGATAYSANPAIEYMASGVPSVR